MKLTVIVVAAVLGLAHFGCGAEHDGPNRNTASDASKTQPRSLPAPVGTLTVQIKDHPVYGSPVEVKVSCVARRTFDPDLKGFVVGLAPEGTVSCDALYKKPEEMTDRDFLFSIMLPGDAPLAPGVTGVTWVQLVTKEFVSTSWIGTDVTLTSADDKRIQGSVRSNESTFLWSIRGDFVAEVCPERTTPDTNEKNGDEPTSTGAATDAAVPEMDGEPFRSQHGLSLRYPLDWRAGDDNEKMFVMYPKHATGTPLATVGVRKPWADHATVGEWKTERDKEDPVYAHILLDLEKKDVRKRFVATDEYTILHWQGRAAPNWVLNPDKSVKELTLHVIEIAYVKGDRVTSAMIWAAFPTESEKLDKDALAIVQSMRFDDLLIGRKLEEQGRNVERLTAEVSQAQANLGLVEAEVSARVQEAATILASLQNELDVHLELGPQPPNLVELDLQIKLTEEQLAQQRDRTDAIRAAANKGFATREQVEAEEAKLELLRLELDNLEKHRKSLIAEVEEDWNRVARELREKIARAQTALQEMKQVGELRIAAAQADLDAKSSTYQRESRRYEEMLSRSKTTDAHPVLVGETWGDPPGSQSQQ